MTVRNARPKGVMSARFGLCFFLFAAAPTQIGYQDVAALVARQPAVAAHWRQHIRASAFGTIHAATFSFSRPIGTTMPRPLSYQLAGLDPGVMMGPWDAQRSYDDPPLPFPTVDRSGKGDRQPVLHPPARAPEAAKAREHMPTAASLPAEPVAPPAKAEPVQFVAAPAEEVATKPEQLPLATLEDRPAVAAEAD